MTAAASETSGPREVVLVKLGGSLLTDKSREAHARHEVIERLAAEIAAVRPALEEGVILGHGSGSFGHVAAARHGLGKGSILEGLTASSTTCAGVAATQDQAARLHRLVIDALLRAGEAPFSWSPSSAVVARAGRPVAGSPEPVWRAVAAGLLPVVYGDVVVDRDWGASICSTEAVLRFLVVRLRRRGVGVRRLLWLGETAGVYDRAGRTLPLVDAAGYRRALTLAGAAAGTDVTGGMRLRLATARALARLGVESLIADGTVPGLLAAALRGEEVEGTRVVADR